ncbi:MraY family glycosyltransferase [soil metagenome]
MVAFGALTALLLAFGWCLAAVRFGPRLGFVDAPDDPDLKIHQNSAVPLGGVGVLLGVGVGWWLAGGFDARVIVPAGAVTLLGLVDDRFRLSARVRLAAQIVIAITVVGLGAVPLDSGRILEAFVGMSLMVVAINAFNLFDGLDGLAGAGGLVAALGVAALAAARSRDSDLAWVMAAALAGFLLLNRHPARVFLGDNGAYLVGFLLAVAVMRASPTGLGAELAVAVLLLGVFLLDLVVTVVRRGLGRRPLFAGDRSHLYDRLVGRGWSVGRVVMGAVIVQFGFLALALLIEAALTN